MKNHKKLNTQNIAHEKEKNEMQSHWNKNYEQQAPFIAYKSKAHSAFYYIDYISVDGVPLAKG